MKNSDNFLISLLWYALSITWFGGIFYVISNSNEGIIIKAFLFIGTIYFALKHFAWMIKNE